LPPRAETAAAPPEAPQATEAASAPAEAASTKGLLDYPKDLLMSVSEFAAAGTAKHTVEFYEDMHQIKENAGHFGDEVSHGEGLKAAGSALKMGWNLLKGLGDAIQTGASSMVGGISMIPTAALNVMDQGGEAAGKKLRASDSAVVRTVGQGLRYVSGENSHRGYLDTIQSASREAEIKARQEVLAARQAEED